MTLPAGWIVPDWPAPGGVHAFVTTRAGGFSSGEYASLNLGLRSGDDHALVVRNRLEVARHLPEMPQWLAQVHGTEVARLEDLGASEVPRADTAITSAAERVCAVLTADCMPLLLCDESGATVAAAHAGWRGLAAGVIERAVAAFGSDPASLLAWMGPTIGPEAFEVGTEVREAFLAADPQADEAFRAHRPGKYLADLYHLARQRLARCGVERIHGGGYCTLAEGERFFSYRRAPKSGRMGAFIWIS